MNACELADYMDDITDMETSPYKQTANMLRQLADEKAELEANLKAQVGLAHRQADRIDKLMIIAEDYQMLIVKLKEEIKDSNDAYALLYKEKSHPVKQLSDEEINNIGRQHLTDGDGAIEFARAIIKEITE